MRNWLFKWGIPGLSPVAAISALVRFGALMIAGLLVNPQAAVAAVQRGSGYGFPEDFSVHGHRIDWLIEITGIFVLLLFVIMVAWMAYSMVKHGRSHTAEYDHGDTRHHVVIALVISMVIFIVVDGNLFYWAVKDLNEVFWNSEAAQAEGAVRVEVNAHQWAFDFRQAGPDGVFQTPDDIIALNELVVPAGRPVVFQLASVDVIHAVYLPNFRMKQDAVPGTINWTWFHPREDAVGEYDLACAEHCGISHYKMKSLLRVLPNAEYERWAADASALSQRAFDPDDVDAHWGWEWQEI